MGKTVGVAFLEVNPDTRKLVLSEKKAAKLPSLLIWRWANCAGLVTSVKPYGFFVDLGGVSGLLLHSCITGGTMRELRESLIPATPFRPSSPNSTPDAAASA